MGRSTIGEATQSNVESPHGDLSALSKNRMCYFSCLAPAVQAIVPLISESANTSALERHTLCVEVGKTLADADAEFKRGVDALETACTTINDGVGIHFQHNAA